MKVIPYTGTQVVVKVTGSIFAPDSSPNEADHLHGVLVLGVSNEQDGSKSIARVLEGTNFYKSQGDTWSFTSNPAVHELHVVAVTTARKPDHEGTYTVTVNGVPHTLDLTNVLYLEDFPESAQNLAAYYPFNGNANDESGNDSHGSVYGATLTVDRLCNSGSAFFFDGIDDYIEVIDPVAIDNGTLEDFTVALWVRPAAYATTNTRPIIIKEADAANSKETFGVVVRGSQFSYSVEAPDGANYGATVSEPFIRDTWYFLALRYRESDRQVRFYLDGVLASEVYAAQSPARGIGELILGQNYVGAQPYEGIIDDVRIYQSVLTATEIQDLFEAGDWSGGSTGCHPPVADAGPDPIIECNDSAATDVTLDGSDSFDPDLGALTFSWTENSIEIATGETPTVSLGLGIHTIMLTVTDSEGLTDTDEVVVTVEDTTPPDVALIGDDPFLVECALDAYTDPGAIVTDACDADPSLVFNGVDDVDERTPGDYTITYTATDASGNETVETRTVTVQDTTPPNLVLGDGGTVLTEPQIVWPPNHKYESFDISDLITSASDACDLTVGPADVVTENATSDEPEEDDVDSGDGNTLNDIVISADCRTVDVRAERQGGGDGRVYTLNLGVADASGNIGTDSFLIEVPKSKNGTVVDSGVVYTVTGCAAETAPTAASGSGAGEPAPEIAEVPEQFVLKGNYPNPFNPQTVIRYELPDAAQVRLTVYDGLGRQVRVLVNEEQPAGRHTARFEAGDLSSGVYVYRLEAGSYTATRMMLLIK